MSPTVFSFDKIKVRIHAGDHNPPHVHVEGKGCSAVFELGTLELLENDGFSRSDIEKIRRQLSARALTLEEVWEKLND
jgi:hypothetical protein